MDSESAPTFQPIEHEEDWAEQGWSTTPTPLTVNSEAGAVISIRLDMDSLKLIDAAAKAAGLTWTDYVRRAAVDTARTAVAEDSTSSESGNNLRLLEGSSGKPRVIDQHDDAGTRDQRRTRRTSGE